MSPLWNNRCGSASRSDYPDSGHLSHIMSRTTSMAGTYKTVPKRENLQNTFSSYYHHLPSTITKFSCIPQSLKRRNHGEYSRSWLACMHCPVLFIALILMLLIIIRCRTKIRERQEARPPPLQTTVKRNPCP